MNALSSTDRLFLQEIVVAATRHPEVQAAAAISEQACNATVARLLPTIMQARLDRQMRIFEMYLGKPDVRQVIQHGLATAMYAQVRQP